MFVVSAFTIGITPTTGSTQETEAGRESEKSIVEYAETFQAVPTCTVQGGTEADGSWGIRFLDSHGEGSRIPFLGEGDERTSLIRCSPLTLDPTKVRCVSYDSSRPKKRIDNIVIISLPSTYPGLVTFEWILFDNAYQDPALISTQSINADCELDPRSALYYGGTIGVWESASPDRQRNR